MEAIGQRRSERNRMSKCYKSCYPNIFIIILWNNNILQDERLKDEHLSWLRTPASHGPAHQPLMAPHTSLPWLRTTSLSWLRTPASHGSRAHRSRNSLLTDDDSRVYARRCPTTLKWLMQLPRLSCVMMQLPRLSCLMMQLHHLSCDDATASQAPSSTNMLLR